MAAGCGANPSSVCWQKLHFLESTAHFRSFFFFRDPQDGTCPDFGGQRKKENRTGLVGRAEDKGSFAPTNMQQGADHILSFHTIRKPFPKHKLALGSVRWFPVPGTQVESGCVFRARCCELMATHSTFVLYMFCSKSIIFQKNITVFMPCAMPEFSTLAINIRAAVIRETQLEDSSQAGKCFRESWGSQ